MSSHSRLDELEPQQVDTLLSDVLDALVVTDSDGNAVYTNAAAQDLYGFDRLADHERDRLDLVRYSRETFEFRTIDGELVPEEDQPLTRALQGRGYNNVELSVRHKQTGVERVFTFTGTRLEGDLPLSVLTIHDVTEFRKAERRYRIAFETNPAPTLIARLEDMALVDVNDGFTELTGIPEEEAVGTSLRELGLLTQNDDLSEAMDRLKATKMVRFQQSRIKRRDADERDVIVSARPIEIEGKPCGIFTFIDITELQGAKRKIEQRTNELAEANAELDAFNYSVSHDLRAPLRGLDGFSKALLDDYGDRLDARAHNYLNRIRASALRMGALIDSLLSLSRLTRGSVSLERVDLSEIAREIAGALEEESPERNVQFVIAAGLVVEGDEAMLRAVIRNLLENAWKFTRHEETARIEVGAESRPEGTVYFVKDNGVGFDMRYADKLFSPFQRFHKPGQFEGQGVGLAISQRIIKRHGGRIWAESRAGEGATFGFILDAAEKAEKA